MNPHERFEQLRDRGGCTVYVMCDKLVATRWLQTGLDKEDVEQEAHLEAWKVFTEYEDKPDDEVMKLINTSVRNHLWSLADRHRRRAPIDNALHGIVDRLVDPESEDEGD